MKKALLAAILMFAGISAHAQTGRASGPSVKPLGPYLMSCSSTTIGTTAAELTGNTTSLATSPGIYGISVLNFDTANTVYCSSQSFVASSGNNIGWPIANTPSNGPRAWYSWAIATVQLWYCVSSGPSTPVEVCLARF